MVGGTDGGPDASGMRFEPGWISCEQALTTQAHPDRTWSALQTESA